MVTHHLAPATRPCPGPTRAPAPRQTVVTTSFLPLAAPDDSPFTDADGDTARRQSTPTGSVSSHAAPHATAPPARALRPT